MNLAIKRHQIEPFNDFNSINNSGLNFEIQNTILTSVLVECYCAQRDIARRHQFTGGPDSGYMAENNKRN